jgi:3,4-dihydroxy 2-butanone 4-phosphate synthase / GTP cyclohydrolase II
MASPAEVSTWRASGLASPVSIDLVSESSLVNRWGAFRHLQYRCPPEPIVHSALVLGEVRQRRPLVRVHSECLTGDVFGSRRCDCGEQLAAAFAAIAQAGEGVVIYLRGHEGRGIGLVNKLRAYALQEQGLDTVEANVALGLPVDSRSYGPAARMLIWLGVAEARLLTNNPEKAAALDADAISVSTVAMPANRHLDNEDYLWAKYARMGHRDLLVQCNERPHQRDSDTTHEMRRT